MAHALSIPNRPNMFPSKKRRHRNVPRKTPHRAGTRFENKQLDFSKIWWVISSVWSSIYSLFSWLGSKLTNRSKIIKRLGVIDRRAPIVKKQNHIKEDGLPKDIVEISYKARMRAKRLAWRLERKKVRDAKKIIPRRYVLWNKKRKLALKWYSQYPNSPEYRIALIRDSIANKVRETRPNTNIARNSVVKPVKKIVSRAPVYKKWVWNRVYIPR